MRWVSAISGKASYADCLEDCCGKLGEDGPDLVVFFVSNAFSAHYASLLGALNERFSQATLLGCSASGLIGGGKETEFLPGLSLLCGWLPDVGVHPFHLSELPDLDGPPSAWRELVAPGVEDVRGMILLADPFSFESELALSGLDFAYPDLPKLGGLASGCHRPGDAVLFCGHEIHHRGCAGVAFSRDLTITPVVAQGCDPVGDQLVITECRGNVIIELDGKPATQALVETVEKLTPERRRVAEKTLFVGLGAGKPALKYGPGDFLVRQVLGLDPRTGSLAVGAKLRNGQTVQFHLRDAETSRTDLRAVLERCVKEGPGSVSGALLFSCLGRGRTLYGELGHDSKLFHEILGEVPLGGFFCNGEFGPVGGESALHGFTSSFALFSS